MKEHDSPQHHPKFRSMRVMLMGVLLLTAILCILMVTLVAVRAMNLTEKNRFQTAMRSYTQQINRQIYREYNTMIHLSQQMHPAGEIGTAVNDYLSAPTPYDRILAQRSIDELLSAALFSNPQICLLTYFDDDGTPWISNMSTKEGFSPTAYPALSRTTDIDLQCFHDAGNRFLASDVVSIIRPVAFDDGPSGYIYVEMQTDVVKNLDDILTEQDIPYLLVQVDQNNRVQYTQTSAFPVGSLFEEQHTENKNGVFMGRSNGFIWCHAGTQYDFKNVLLLSETYYEHERRQLLLDIFAAILVAISLIILLSLVFYSQLYAPLKVLRSEISKMGAGDMAIRSHPFFIQEYDVLYRQFMEMKVQISDLMADIYDQEREKQRLELDKLYFQINPHFIMNALNSAQWQAKLESQLDIAAYLANLNFILAYTLGKVSQNTTLRTEIQMLNAYLSLQKTRQDFEVHMDIQPGLYLDRPCARLILQPIAENAVCHNINDFGHLYILTHELPGGQVRIEVKDDGPGFDAKALSFQDLTVLGGERQTKAGIGLRYVYLSLQDFYGDKAELRITSAPGEGTCVSVLLPAPPKKKRPVPPPQGEPPSATD